jgi:hypothetical protein
MYDDAMKKRKSKMGRPPLGKKAQNIVLSVKVSALEKAAFTKRARAEGKTVSAWVLEPRRRERAKER